MSGHATFSGTTYQAKVIAFIYVHILAEARLRWLEPLDDTPLAVSGESGGPGDDARVEFVGPTPDIEVQAKHGFNAGEVFRDFLSNLRDSRAAGDNTRVLLAVDRESTSNVVTTNIARGVERIAAGRTDGLGGRIKELFDEFGESLLAAPPRLSEGRWAAQ